MRLMYDDFYNFYLVPNKVNGYCCTFGYQPNLIESSRYAVPVNVDFLQTSSKDVALINVRRLKTYTYMGVTEWTQVSLLQAIEKDKFLSTVLDKAQLTTALNRFYCTPSKKISDTNAKLYAYMELQYAAIPNSLMYSIHKVQLGSLSYSTLKNKDGEIIGYENVRVIKNVLPDVDVYVCNSSDEQLMDYITNSSVPPDGKIELSEQFLVHLFGFLITEYHDYELAYGLYLLLSPYFTFSNEMSSTMKNLKNELMIQIASGITVSELESQFAAATLPEGVTPVSDAELQLKLEDLYAGATELPRANASFESDDY